MVKKVKNKKPETPHVHILKRTILIPSWLIPGVFIFIAGASFLLFLTLRPSTELGDYMTLNKTYRPPEKLSDPDLPDIPQQSQFQLFQHIIPIMLIGGAIAFVLSGSLGRRQRNHLLMFLILIIIFGLVAWWVFNNAQISLMSSVSAPSVAP